MKNNIIAYIKAGYPALYMVSAEENRVQALIGEITSELQANLFSWDCLNGILNVATGTSEKVLDPIKAISSFIDLPEDSILLLQDFHLYLQKPPPALIRVLKNAYENGKAQGKTLIVLGCRQFLTPELEKYFTVIDFPLPEKDTLKVIADGLAEGSEKPLEYDEDAVLQSLRGTTTMEAENALALSLCKQQTFDPVILSREKIHAIEKSGILKYEEESRSFSDVGGLDVVKEYAGSLKGCFSQDALDFGLSYPKGIILVGVPGSGKSLISKIIARELEIPLVSLDVGKLFGSLVGQTEANTREFIKLAEAVAPVLVHIDELEKGFAGTKGSGQSDSGTTARAFSTLLTWLQEKKAPVFISATANDVSKLPPEFLRRGRWDEMFFVDLPTMEEREAIWKIHLKKVGRKLKDYDLKALALTAEGFTGAEIESAVIRALRTAFCNGKKLTMDYLIEATNNIIPLSRSMADEITEMRKWSDGRAMPASIQPQVATKGRRVRSF